jgi:23S rRNA (adenine2503-C2)-methyltransferase
LGKRRILQNIIGITKDQLAEKLKELGLEKFRTKQIWQWLYQKGSMTFAEMTNLSPTHHQLLNENFSITYPSVSTAQKSTDGTIKWLLKFADCQEVETVYIPTSERGTLCVSSQVGCSLTCSFCHTGTQKLVRNLTPADIIGQFMHARNEVGADELSNIVMMGMGEPLLNYESVKTALLILLDEDGCNLSKRKITLSTSGIVPYIQACGEELGVNLAISLHAVRDELRDELVPINKKWNIATLLDACREYYGAAQSFRRVTFEYVMLKDVNDSDEDAKTLIKLLKGINSKINIIPFNPWPGTIYECSDKGRINQFAAILNNGGLEAPVRTPRGRDILAACGQLKSESLKSATN